MVDLKKYYIAGPVFGKEDRNEKLFRQIAWSVDKYLGTSVVPLDLSPQEHDGPCPGHYGSADENHLAACHLRADIAGLLACDGIVLIPGWRDSNGVRVELAVATAIGLEIWHYKNGQLLRLDDA